MRSPSRTVTTGSTAGAVTIIVVWAATAIWPQLVIPPEVASAFTLLVTAGAAWIVPDPERRPRH
ncbi:hypothetical protein QP868_11950 [Brevibacterium sp. UMB1308A]|uniref:hypothetical protein n=1 Tax=Brevibacterium sp. UMB1308A TaxID=3050608 RepID=UPI00254A2F1B|nr:hypothetical protein [Brevibacterium sp. UMB1308A]MDK8347581.1 hypothetical protein [Brevibacterium sp. UMB1308B]MDK8714597.1 hypothetical protein [Brevibacterium sp. UMB1308A]